MKKRIRNISLLAIGTILGLTSCNLSFEVGGGDSSTSAVTPSTSSNGETTPDNSENVPVDKLARAYSMGLDVREKYNLNFLPSLPSVGNSKMLVVPVRIKGAATLNITDAQIKTSLNKAFFGKTEDTGWESVSSFYNKSSYGKLNITGTVSDVLDTSVTMKQLNSAGDQQATELTNKVLEEAYEKFFINGTYNVDDYDSNKDGHIDSVYLVYLAEENPNKPALWAYTYWWDSLNEADYDKYGALGAYCWSSFNFMLHDHRFSLDKPDAHTYIHESGHLQSLDDYYNYYDASTSPMGGIDMMDYNIGDHSSFTKYSLGWIVPEVIMDTDNIESKEITLRPFEESGDALVIANNFNQSSLDEFLILEYYTPTGLNEADAKTRYELGGSTCFTKPGIKIYHADQRIGQLKYDQRRGWTWNGKFTDRIVTTPDSYTKILGSNGMNPDTKEGYSESGFNLITLMDGSRAKSTSTVTKFEEANLAATDKTLFKEGDTFENHYEDYTFNDGSQLKYNIEIASITPEGATIRVTKK